MIGIEKYTESAREKLKIRLAKAGDSDIAAMSYESYMRTALWRKIREWVLAREEFRCDICRAEQTDQFPLDIHHRSYGRDVKEGRNAEMLSALCQRCHGRVETRLDKTKRQNLEEKDLEFVRLKTLHRTVENEGLPLSVVRSSTKVYETVETSYVGSGDLLEFYDLGWLLFKFLCQRKSFFDVPSRIPGLSSKSVRQKSGVRMLCRDSDRLIANIKLLDKTIVFKCRQEYDISLESKFREFVAEQKYWFFSDTRR